MALKKTLLAVFGIVTLIGTQVSATEFIVKFKTQKQFSNSYVSLRNLDGLTLMAFHRPGRIAKIDLLSRNQTELERKLSVLRKRTDIEYIVPNIKFTINPVLDDIKFQDQWALDKINAVGAWLHTKGSSKVVIAVVDTGVDYNHEDLKANIWTNAKEIPNNGIDDDNNGFIDDVHGWNFHDNTNDPMDQTSEKNPGHGTHCAGIIGAVGVGVSGINQVVSIMPVKFLGADGSGDLFASTKAIDYAVANGANIISASWGAPISESMAKPIIDAISRARDKGVIFVVAAANDGTNNDSKSIFPANTNLDNVIAVAATDVNDQKPKWSNYGKKMVALGAPGADIKSTVVGNAYKKLSGTSMATPLVAGTVGLLLSLDPTLKGPAAKAILQSSGTAMDLEVACKCRIDAAKATDMVADKMLTIIPTAATLKTGEKVKLSAYAGQPPYSFKSMNTDVATVSADGELTGVKEGDATIVVTDANGTSTQSRAIRISNEAPAPGGTCPYDDPMICQIMCVIAPESPWCSGTELPDIPGMPGLPRVLPPL